MRGTARIPTDLDDDPDARRAEMEAYREERERKRAEEAAAKEEKEALERATKEEMRLRNAQKAKETALAREKKQREKAERAHKRATMNQTKLQRAQNNKARKARRFQQIREQKEAEKEDAEKRNREMNDNTPLSLKRVVELKNVTHDTPDPRSFLYFQDLQSLCLGRSLSDEAGSKEELVQRLRDDDEKVYHTVAELRRVCRNKGLNIAGTSAMLKYQLALSEAKGYASFNAVPAADDDVPMTE
jgi:phage-related minor tail protein